MYSLIIVWLIWFTTWSPICAAQMFQGYPLEYSQPTGSHTLQENCLSPKIFTTNCSLAWVKTWCSLHFPTWSFVCLELPKFCASCLNGCAFICASALLCLDSTVSLKSYTTSGSSNLYVFHLHDDFLDLTKCDTDVPFEAEYSAVSFLHLD